MRNVAADQDMLVNLFERIHLFLQRLRIYTGVPLTEELTALLGKIMAQLLSILALSAKAMTDGKISKLTKPLRRFLADYDLETFLKRLAGRTDVENALLRLDSLTKEECLMMVARNLDVTHATKYGTELFRPIFIHVQTFHSQCFRKQRQTSSKVCSL